MKKYIIVALVILSSVLGAYVTNLYWLNKYDNLVTQLQKAKAENMQYVLDVERLQRDKSNAIANMLAAEQSAREAKAKVITKEVVKYVKTNSNSTCKLDDDWVHISDAATPMPRTANATIRVDVAGENIRDLGHALTVVTNNYGACQDSVDRLEGWQRWYESVSRK